MDFIWKPVKQVLNCIVILPLTKKVSILWYQKKKGHGINFSRELVSY